MFIGMNEKYSWAWRESKVIECLSNRSETRGSVQVEGKIERIQNTGVKETVVKIEPTNTFITQIMEGRKFKALKIKFEE